MVERCPRCGLAFQRSEGFWLGAMAVNIGVTELAFGVFVGVALAVTWPTVPWLALTVAAAVVNVVVPILFYPFSKTIFLAFDLVMRQAEPQDAHELEENDPIRPTRSSPGDPSPGSSEPAQ